MQSFDIRRSSRRSGVRGQPGYVLLEMLIATAIGGALLGVLFHFAVSVHTTVAVQADAVDLQQRLRVAVEVIRHDLLLAGAGPSRGVAQGPLARTFPPIIPARTGMVDADPELTFHDDRITILYVPETRAETALAAPMVDTGSPIVIDAGAPGCPPARACDFAVGDRAAVFETAGAGSAHEIFTVAAVDTALGTLTPASPLSRPYAVGSRVVVLVQRVYHLDRVGKRLMQYDGARSDLPVVDHVVELRFAYFGDPRPDAISPPPTGMWNCAYAGLPPVPILANLGGMGPKPLRDSALTDGPICGEAPNRFDADLLRIRRVALTIRLETESPAFRGSGPQFATSGFSRTGTKSVPDLQTTVEVTPRNLAVSW